MGVPDTHSVHHREDIDSNEPDPAANLHINLTAQVLDLLDANDIIFYDPKQQTYFLFHTSGAARNKALPLCDSFVEKLVHWLVRKWLRKINGTPNPECKSPWSEKQLRAFVWWRVGRAEFLRFVLETGKFAKGGVKRVCLN